jgi:hypothetical protein
MRLCHRGGGENRDGLRSDGGGGGHGIGRGQRQRRLHRAPPSFGSRLDTRYSLGLAKARGTIKILLDIDRVMGTKELAVIEELGA